jgi:hypothetical protein
MRNNRPKPKEDEGYSVLGFLGNVAGDVKDIALGIIPGAYDVTKTMAQATYGGSIGLIPGTGGDLARRSASAGVSRLADATWDTLKQSGSNWKRVLTGDFKPLYEDGALMGLDVAAIASLGGGALVKGASVASKTGRRKVNKVVNNPRVVQQARRAGGARVDMNLLLDELGDAKLSADYAAGKKRVARYSNFANSTKLAARQRPDRVIDNTVSLPGLEELAAARGMSRNDVFTEGTVSVPQRNLARTPLARALQKPLIALTDKAVQSNKVTRGLSDKRLAARVVNAADRRARDVMADRSVAAGVRDFDDALKSKEVRKDPLAKVAATLHIEGVLGGRRDLSPQQARDNAVRTATIELERLKRDPEIDSRSLEDAEQQVRYLQELPDELVTLQGNSSKVQAVRRVVETGRRYSDNLRQYDLYDLDENEARDIRRERETISQRILVGGARAFRYGGEGTESTRAMVPETFMRMVRGGEVTARPGAAQAAAGRLREIVREEQVGGEATGQLAYDFLAQTKFAEGFRAARTPEQQIEYLRRVEAGGVRTTEGRRATPDEVRSASREIQALRQGERRERPVAEQDTVVAFRVRDTDGNSTKWVRSADGEVPEVLGKNRRRGDIVERAQVPAKLWFNRQDADGRVSRLPSKVEEGNVTGKDGRTFGVTRTAVVRGGDDPGVGDGPERFDLPRAERPERRGGQSVERLRAVVPQAVARALDNSSLSPGSRQAVVEFLEYGKPRGSVSSEKLVVRRLIELGLVDISAAAKELSRGGFSQKVISEGIDKMLNGKLPLTKSGYVDLDALTRRLKSDRKLRDLWNAPELLSRVEILPGAYIEHRNASGYAGQNLLDKGKRATTSPVAPERGVRRTSGTLAKGLRYSLDPRELIVTSTSLLKTVSNREFLQEALYWAATEARTVRNPLNGKEENVREPKVYTGRTARSMDKSKWVAVPVTSFNKADVWLRGWKPGDEGLEGKTLVREIDAIGDNEQVYLFPKEFGDRLTYAWSNPSGVGRLYDNIMQMWRGGILALAPRWYINNFVGNTVFYGFYTGFDGYSIRLARQIGDSAVPYRVYGDGFASQAYDQTGIPGDSGPVGKTKLTKAFFNTVERGYEINAAIEGTFRKAAYIHAVRKILKDEGLLTDVTKSRGAKRRANDVEMLEAIANAPDYLKVEAVREMERWMGDYRNLGKVERQFVRRALPFYSWMKVINTWLFGLPFRSPIRAEIMAMAGQIGSELQGDRSYLPWWEQGRIELTDGISLRTSGLNPFQSVLEPLLPLGTKDSSWNRAAVEMVASLGGQMAPPLQGAIGFFGGRQTFGDRDFTAPTGADGSVTAYGKSAQTYNKITGQLESRSNKGNVVESVLQMVPGIAQLRDVVSMGRTPYDSASTIDLVLDRLGMRGSDPLYQPPAKNKSGRDKLRIGNFEPPLGYLGVPLGTFDSEKEKSTDRKRRWDFGREGFLQNRLIAREQSRRENA